MSHLVVYSTISGDRLYRATRDHAQRALIERPSEWWIGRVIVQDGATWIEGLTDEEVLSAAHSVTSTLQPDTRKENDT